MRSGGGRRTKRGSGKLALPYEEPEVQGEEAEVDGESVVLVTSLVAQVAQQAVEAHHRQEGVGWALGEVLGV